MKESKKDLEKAIILVGDSLGLKRSIEILLKNVGLHSTVKEITYQMFVQNKQQYFEKDDDVFKAISLIRKYCQEMSENGEVKFDMSLKEELELGWEKLRNCGLDKPLDEFD